jgi:hypothetical protein
MKYLILAKNDKRIIHISNTLSYNKVGGLILDSGLQIVPGICDVAEVQDVPSEIITEKFYYINNEYVINPNYEENRKDKLLKLLEK